MVNFELPNVAEDYVHRIGRTGRAGSTGAALSLVDSEEMSYLKDIEKLIKRSIVRVEIEGFVPPLKSELMSEERPPRPPQGRGGQPNGRSGQANGRNASGRSQQGNKPSATQSASAPRAAQPASATRNGPPAAHKPRPQAALFSAKPGTRGR